MAPKVTPFSDVELEILLKFVNANKTLLLDPSNKNSIVHQKNAKWAEIANTLSLKGTARSMRSVAEKWHNSKKDAKREWDQAYVKKPTGGGKSYEFSWKTKFIIETIGIEFHPPATILGGFDTSNFSAECNDETSNPMPMDNEYCPNDTDLILSSETLDVSRSSASPLSTSSKMSDKRKKRETIEENDEKSKEMKYKQILDSQLEVHQLEKYKLLLEIGLLKAKRSRLGLPEEPETITTVVYASL